MTINPYLGFNGQCEAAFRFYEKVFGGKIVAMFTNGESPMAKDMPADQLSRIMHARLIFGDNVLMGGDAPPEYYTTPQGMMVSVNVDEPTEAERIYAALVENGVAKMPIGETFWALRFAMLIDQFGTPWMINCEKPM
ncbi:MAG: VOC family protein [Capsulimonadaceae bacterium]|nr:VOC family protein [Capsulimonadaceae bacterium]